MPTQGGPGRAIGAQGHFAALVEAVLPDRARGKPGELWWRDEARVGQQVG